MIYTIGITITIFLAFILLTKKKKSAADTLLFVWLCLILMHLSLFALIFSGKYIHFPHLLGLEIPLPLLHGPFLFFYTKSLTMQKTVAWKKTLHLLPFALALIAILPFLFLSSESKISVYQNGGEAYAIVTRVIFAGIIISGIIYSLLSLQSLMEHKRKIKNNYSYTEKINLQWLFNLIIGLSCIWIIALFADDETIFSSVVLYVVFIGYFGIKQVGIFTVQTPLEKPISTEPQLPKAPSPLSENTKYENSSLDDEQLKNIHAAFKKLIEEEKLYLTPELTLSMVSEKLDVHPNTLSEVINRMEKKNFFDCMNTLRVEEFKERVIKPENQKFTLLSLAYDCGFNSKTSFNRNFKNITGKSPSAYLKEIKITLR